MKSAKKLFQRPQPPKSRPGRTAWLILASFLAACSAPVQGPANSLTPATGPADKTLFAMYLVGSNLEDDVKPRNGKPDEAESGEISPVGAGSLDLMELVTAWQQMSPAARSRVEVLVAFGGARKQGWQGVKYADMNCLQRDASDSYFGNADCYVEAKADANMADPATLSQFLSYLKQQYGSHGRKVLNIWNHGLAFLGAGQDSTQTKPTDYITLPEMKQAFSQVPLRFDLLAFDACLMASLEVARTVAPFADYLLASEELEPAHGWHYGDVLKAMSSANLSIPALGKQLIDSYIDHAEHQKPSSNQKTLSMMDLKQVDAVTNALDHLVNQLDLANFEPLLQSLTQSQHFGLEPRGQITYAIDLRHWAEQLKANVPALATPSEQLISRLDQLVLHARHDANKPNANGVSIYSLNQNLQARYGKDQSVSTPWLSFARSFIAQGSKDGTRPSVSGSGFATAQQRPDDLCQKLGKSGHCLNVTDDLGLARVEQVFALQADARYLFAIGSERLNVEQGQVFAPIWDGEWFLVCDGDCTSGKSLFPPAYFETLSERGNRIYSSEAELNGMPVVFYIELGRNRGVVNHWAVPYEIGSDGEVILARQQQSIGIGDRLSFYYQVYDLETQSRQWKRGETLSFGHNPAWSFARIEAPRAYYVSASDYQGNLGLSPLYKLP